MDQRKKYDRYKVLTKTTSSPFRYSREKRTSSTRASRFNAAGDFRARTLVRCPHRSTQRQTFQIPSIPERNRETARSLMVILELG